MTSSTHALCLAVSLLTAADATGVHAQTATEHPNPEPVASGLSPTWFWFSASATIICASLGGFYALRVRDRYDQALETPPVSPMRVALHEQMRTDEVTADALFAGALALAVGTTILAFHIDWSGGPEAPREPGARARPSRWAVTPVLSPERQALVLRGALP